MEGQHEARAIYSGKRDMEHKKVCQHDDNDMKNESRKLWPMSAVVKYLNHLKELVM